MAQADSNHTTPAPVDPTRRRFMSQAASVAAGSAVLAVGATIPAPARALQRVPDPILATIEAHRAIKAAFYSVLHEASALEEAIPLTLRQSFIDPGETLIVETDDPRWIENTREVSRLNDAENDAALALLTVRPETPAGMLALLQYALSQDTDGQAWGMELVTDDGRQRHWYYFLIESVVATLTGVETECA